MKVSELKKYIEITGKNRKTYLNKNPEFATVLKRYIPELYFIGMEVPYTVIPIDSATNC